MIKKRKIALISVNNTLEPKTGGEFVYKVIKDELLRQKYIIDEISVPVLLKRLSTLTHHREKMENLYRLMLHFKCVLHSLLLLSRNNHIMITSSHPAFPVFGHLVYHQPKAGTGYKINREYLNLYWKLGWMVVENEILSPLWCLAKRSYVLHLSNSYFTKNMIKELYDLDSSVLYPPVRLSPIFNKDVTKKRNFGLVIAKPEVPSGITFLPKIVENMPKNIKLTIIGKADLTGFYIIRMLKREGYNIEYLGYVSEEKKWRLLTKYSHYLHLSLYEPFGITVVEAMAAGCIPIASRSGGIPEYLPQEFLYSNVDEAKEKIVSKIGMGDINVIKKLRNIAYKFREENFRSNFINYIRVLEKILD